MPSNPNYLPTAPVRWMCAVQGDGASPGQTETYYPTGVVIAEPTDDNEKISTGGASDLTLYRDRRTLRMVEGILQGDLPVDLEGTGWAWRFTAALTYEAPGPDGKMATRAVKLAPFMGISKLGQTLDLAQASRGQIVAGVWTTQGKDGAGIKTLEVVEGNALRAELSDGRTLLTQPLDLTGVTGAGLPSGTVDGQALVWSDAQKTWVPGSATTPSGSTTVTDPTTTAAPIDQAWS